MLFRSTALELAREFKPDVMLLDIGLPDIDGYEVARRFRAESGHETTLVALTGYGQEEDKRKASEAGFDHHLTKPAGIREIEKILAMLEAEHHAQDAAQETYEASGETARALQRGSQ